MRITPASKTLLPTTPLGNRKRKARHREREAEISRVSSVPRIEFKKGNKKKEGKGKEIAFRLILRVVDDAIQTIKQTL